MTTLFRSLEKTEINLSPDYDKTATIILQEEENKNLIENSATEIVIKEVESKNPVDNPSKVVTSVTSLTQQGIEAVNPVVLQAVPSVVTTIVDWKTYPYNSSDRYTLENRANKVKERILDCSTNNDLIKLLANNKVSEPEIEWLVQNYLTKTERKQLEIVYKSTQGNLFNQTQAEVEIIEYTLSEIIEAIDREMERLGWTVEQGRQYLMDNYGKRSRLHLNDEELMRFWGYLKDLGKESHEKK